MDPPPCFNSYKTRGVTFYETQIWAYSYKTRGFTYLEYHWSPNSEGTSNFFLVNPKSKFFGRVSRAKKMLRQTIIFGRFRQFIYFYPQNFRKIQKNKMFPKMLEISSKSSSWQIPKLKTSIPELKKTLEECPLEVVLRLIEYGADVDAVVSHEVFQMQSAVFFPTSRSGISTSRIWTRADLGWFLLYFW